VAGVRYHHRRGRVLEPGDELPLRVQQDLEQGRLQRRDEPHAQEAQGGRELSSGGARAAAVLVAAALCAACSPQLSLEADPQPIPLDLISDVPITVAIIPGREPFRILIDTAAPVTAVDAQGQPPGIQLVSELRLLRPDDTHVVRAILHDFNVARTPLYQAGLTTPVAVGGVLGADVLVHYAVRFDYPAGTGTAAMTFTERTYDAAKPETDDDLAGAGRVVVQSLVLGGGSYDLGPDAAALTATRMTLPACALMHDGRAVDMRLLVATGYGPLTLGRSAAERLFGRPVGATEVDRLYVPGIPGGIAVLERGSLFDLAAALALVGDEHNLSGQPTSDFGGPCTQLLRHQRFLQAAGSTLPADCPPAHTAGLGCGPGNSTVGAAYAEICGAAGAVGYAVIDDAEPLLQSLRAELRPHLPALDGFAGTELLQYLSTELNYRNSRIILDCPPDRPCVTCTQFNQQHGRCFQQVPLAGAYSVPRTSFPSIDCSRLP
jgi:hypothetical protein